MEGSSNQTLPVTWTKHHVGIEDALEKLETLGMIRPSLPSYMTYHGGAQRRQYTSLKSFVHFCSTITSSFEYSGCTLSMPSPTILGAD